MKLMKIINFPGFKEFEDLENLAWELGNNTKIAKQYTSLAG
jgi:hypothetical protein